MKVGGDSAHVCKALETSTSGVIAHSRLLNPQIVNEAYRAKECCHCNDTGLFSDVLNCFQGLGINYLRQMACSLEAQLSQGLLSQIALYHSKAFRA